MKIILKESFVERLESQVEYIAIDSPIPICVIRFNS
jgi:hypothetical protein